METNIKTRNVVRGTIKQVDRSIESSNRIHTAYAKTKELIDTSNTSECDSPSAYANQRTFRGGRAAADAGIHRINEVGRSSVKALRSNRQKSVMASKMKKKENQKEYQQMVKNDIVKDSSKTMKSTGRGIKTSIKPTKYARVASLKVANTSAKTSFKTKRVARMTALSAKYVMIKSVIAVKVAVKISVVAIKKVVLGIKALVAAISAGGAVAVLIILVCMLFGSAMFLFGNHNSGNQARLSADVLAYESIIREIAKEHGREDFTLLIMAVMMQESGGRGNDPMQSSESPYNIRFPNAPNSITDPIYSIEVGIRHLNSSLTLAKVENPIDMERIPLSLQGYNFGNHYIPWAIENFGGHSMASAIAFSEMMAKRLGWSGYGDINYPGNVLRYYPLGAPVTGNTQFAFPVGGNWQITSPFGNRTNPISGADELHTGVDIVTDIPNAPIYAIAGGTVVYSGWNGGYGYYVVIQHDDTTFSGYAHNRENLVRVGDIVYQGQQIAVMGTTGLSTGVHLHLNIMMDTRNYNSGHVNPMSLFGIE